MGAVATSAPRALQPAHTWTGTLECQVSPSKLAGGMDGGGGNPCRPEYEVELRISGTCGFRSFSPALRAGSCLCWNPGPPHDPGEWAACPQARARQEAATLI